MIKMAGIYATTIIMISIFINFFLIATTHAVTEIKAKMKGGMLLFILSRDKTMKMVYVKPKAETVDVDGYGTFMINPESIYRIKKGNLPMAVAYGDYGTILNPRVIKAIEELKKTGVENLEDTEQINARLYSCNAIVEKEVENKEGTKETKEVPCGFIGLVEFQEVTDKKGKVVGYKFDCPKCHGTDMTKEPLKVLTPSHDTINFHDIVGFFKYNINPNFIKVRIERRIAEALAEQRDSFMQLLKWISMMSILVVCAAVAYVIIVQNAPAGGIVSGVSGTLGSMVG